MLVVHDVTLRRSVSGSRRFELYVPWSARCKQSSKFLLGLYERVPSKGRKPVTQRYSHTQEQVDPQPHCCESLTAASVPVHSQPVDLFNAGGAGSLRGKNWIRIHYLRHSYKCLRGSVTDLSLRRPGFDPRSVHVKFVLAKVELGQHFSEWFSFLPSITVQQLCIINCTLRSLLSEGQAGDS